MAHNPIRHEAAIAAAGDAHPLRIDPGILLNRRVYPRHDVLVIHATPVIDDSALEFLPIPRRPARIAEEYRPSLRRVDLEFVIPIHAVLTRRSAVNAQYEWV